MQATATEDVAQIERGLPQGADKLAPLWSSGSDPKTDLKAVRRALAAIRRDVPDLTVAKSTFFVAPDQKGVAIRNDLEEDAMAGKDLVALFPGLAKATTGGYVATTGKFPGPDLPSGPDKDWIAGTPVKKPDGSIGGVLVTGWTYKRFVYHLEESLRHDLTEKQGNGKLPIVYVLVFDKTGAYGARATPAVNAKALADLDLPAKTASAPAEGTMNVTDRDYGWAAARVPKLGPDSGVAVMWSEL